MTTYTVHAGDHSTDLGMVGRCGSCGADTLSETGDIATGGACQCCFHAYAMRDDDWCYSCAVAQELDDCRVMARTQRAVGDWERTVREITLAQAGAR